MTRWLRRVRGALLMGLIWAVIWMPVGLLIGAVADPDGSMDEPWILVGTYPGFLAGVLFSALLGVAARRRKLRELSVAKVARWGAFAGLAIGSVPFMMGSPSERVSWWLPFAVVTSITFLSSFSAAGSLVLAKRADQRQLSEGGADVDEIAVTEHQAERLPR